MKEQEPEDEFYSDAEHEPSLDHTEDTEIASEPLASSSVSPKTDLVPFDSLKGYINYDTLKALTFKPFQLTAMSEVQKRVLKLMPYLSGGKLRGVARDSGTGDAREVENDVEEDAEGEQRGREDLLVKAKTGTGKTIVGVILGQTK